MGCTNELDKEALMAARNPRFGSLLSAMSEKEVDNAVLEAARNPGSGWLLSKKGLRAIGAVVKAGGVKKPTGGRTIGQRQGSISNAVGRLAQDLATRYLIQELGHDLLFDEAAAGARQGIDLVTVDHSKANTVICLVEVKGTLQRRQSRPTLDPNTKQGTPEWFAGQGRGAGRSKQPRTRAAGLDQLEPGDIGSSPVSALSVHLNLATGQVRMWALDSQGKPGAQVIEPFPIHQLLRYQEAEPRDNGPR